MANGSTSEDFCSILKDMRENNETSNKEVNMVVVIVHGFFSCFGILENILILWMVGFRLQHKTVASVWVLNLAFSDFLATLTLPLFTLYLYQSQSWEVGDILCKIQTSIFFANMFVSAFLLAAISLDRLILVVKPFWSKEHRTVLGAWKLCALGWLWAAINTVPYTVFRSVIKRKDGRNMCYHNFALLSSSRATVERNCKVRQEATAISKLLLAFLCPLGVIVGSYIQISLRLMDRNRRRRRQTSFVLPNPRPPNTSLTTRINSILFKQTASNDPVNLSSNTPINSSQINEKQLSPCFIRMVTFLIAAFILCWGPYHIFCILEVVAHYHIPTRYAVEKWLPIATTISFLNPVLDPILYVFSCPQFCVRVRQSLGAVFDTLVREDDEMLRPFGNSRRAHRWQQSFQRVEPEVPM
ncbi:prostaglandin D2 receptor 2-like isoform X2 [Cynoglossus semilaevis]|nr:prostaglandin D2 receptor 2-like isoform X2 [Cynoglossus semilaevis]XP_024914148.1 prostaglandin D2 receptor 2-like isoform X2 [Cynoglossus semilaevis]